MADCNRFFPHSRHAGPADDAHGCEHGGKNQQTQVHPVDDGAEALRLFFPEAEQYQAIKPAHDVGGQQQEEEQEQDGKQPRGGEQQPLRQNRREKHGAAEKVQKVEFERRHGQQRRKRRLPSPMQTQRQDGPPENVARKQCFKNQDHAFVPFMLLHSAAPRKSGKRHRNL